MRTIKPIYDYDKYSVDIQRAISETFYRTLFAPLYAILDQPITRNNAANEALKDAIRSGRLTYDNGFFYGSLTATLSKQLRAIGAVFHKTKKAYFLPVSGIPIDVKLAIRDANEAANAQVDLMKKFLDSREGKKIVMPDIKPMFETVFQGLDKQFSQTTKIVTAKDLEIPIEERFKQALSEAYTENLDLYIQDWHDREILKLRKMVEKNVSEGYRSSSMVEQIKAERGVSHRKAKFLARQETSLMVSKYREIRYKEIGLNKYIWSSSHDKRVRHDHKILDGKVFDFEHPPVTDLSTGARNNPGEDYNCRCVAIPVLTNSPMRERKEYLKEVANV